MVVEVLSPLLKPQFIATSAVAYVVWTIVKGIYNVYLHPLATFPGPKWAAFSIWWKINLEIFQGKNLVEELHKLHGIYGKSSFKDRRVGVDSIIQVTWSALRRMRCVHNCSCNLSPGSDHLSDNSSYIFRKQLCIMKYTTHETDGLETHCSTTCSP